MVCWQRKKVWVALHIFSLFSIHICSCILTMYFLYLLWEELRWLKDFSNLHCFSRQSRISTLLCFTLLICLEFCFQEHWAVYLDQRSEMLFVKGWMAYNVGFVVSVTYSSVSFSLGKKKGTEKLFIAQDFYLLT